jgi:hypothetical protein
MFSLAGTPPAKAPLRPRTTSDANSQGKWSIVNSPNASTTQTNVFYGMTCVSASDCWAVGYYVNGSATQTLIERWDGSSWAIVSSPNTLPTQDNVLNGVTCVSPSECWAVGYYHNGSVNQSLIERWNGTSWAIVSSPNILATQNNYLSGVTCVPASNCWAVGYYLNASIVYQSLIERWDGSSWAIVSSANTLPTQSNFLYGITCTSASNCWAVGYYFISGVAYQSLIQRWDGSSWVVVSSPNTLPTQDNVLNGVTCVSASDCWAVGYYYSNGVASNGTLIERWNGTSWSIVSSPSNSASAKNVLNGVTCVSASNCWAVGSYYTGGGDQTLIEHWDGTLWTIAPSPNTSDRATNILSGVTCVSASDCWAVGNHYNGGPFQTLTEHYTVSLSPNPITFEKAFDGGADDSGYSALQDDDGNFVILGTTSSFGAGANDMYLQKTDNRGKLLWAKSYGGAANNEESLHLASTSDGGYILAGRSYSFGAGNEDAYLVKTDRDGNLQWSKVYGTPKIERAYSVRQTSDGGYILVGTSFDYQNTLVEINTYEVLLIKVTSTGDLVWAKRYDAHFNEQGYDVEQTSDGGYIVTGIAQGDPLGFSDLLLMKTDGSGNIEWANAYGGALQEQASSVRQLGDGSYLVGGFTNSSGAGSGDGLMMKVNSGGSIQWAKTYGGVNNELCYSAQPTSDGGYLLTGSAGSFGAGSFDGYLVKTDGSGNLQWSRAYGGSNVEFGNVGFETSDGGYLLAGVTRSFSATADVYLVKTDAIGNSGCHDVPAATVVTVSSPPVIPLNFNVTSGGIATADAATQIGTAPITENTLCASVSLTGVTSRKIHGSAGTFDVDLTNGGIECRGGGANGDYILVFTFADLLASVSGASVSSGTGSVSSGSIDRNDAHNYIVSLTGVTRAERITIRLTNVSDSIGNFSDTVSSSMAVLVGDVNGNRAVTNTDVSATKAQVAAPVDASNFRNDVNANGVISNTDVSAAKAQVGSTLP